MRYTKNDIRNIPLTEFMAALGEKPVKAFKEIKYTMRRSATTRSQC